MATSLVFWIVVIRAVFCYIVLAVSVRMVMLAIRDRNAMKRDGLNGLVLTIIRGHITDGFYLTATLGVLALWSSLSWWSQTFRDQPYQWRHVVIALVSSIVPVLLGAMKLLRWGRYHNLVEAAMHLELQKANAHLAEREKDKLDRADVAQTLKNQIAEVAETATKGFHEANDVNQKIARLHSDLLAQGQLITALMKAQGIPVETSIEKGQ